MRWLLSVHWTKGRCLSGTTCLRNSIKNNFVQAILLIGIHVDCANIFTCGKLFYGMVICVINLVSCYYTTLFEIKLRYISVNRLV